MPPIGPYATYESTDAMPCYRQVLEVGDSRGECTALACSSCGRYLGMGTRGGGIVVWDLTQRPPLLVRKLVRVPCDLPTAVMHLQWSAPTPADPGEATAPCTPPATLRDPPCPST